MSEDVIVDGSGEDIAGFRPIDETDLEISYNMSGDHLVLRVNKAGVCVFRVLLADAAKKMSGDQLFHFSTFAPDFVFKIGDMAEGVARLTRSLGLSEEECARARVRLLGSDEA